MIYVSVDTPATIELGKQGETGVTEIAFDTTKWENEFGPGSVQLSHLRSGSGQPYPVVLRREKGVSVWTVSLPDTEYSGYGSAQLSYLVDGKVKKSCCYNTVVSASLNKPGPVPAPEKAFGDKVAEDAMKAEQARQAIENLSVSAKEGETVSVEKQTQEDGSVNLAFTLPAGGPGGGTADHTKLTNRDQPNQHPIGAIEGLTDALAAINERLTAFFDSDDQTLDQLTEIIAYIKSNKTLIDAITSDKVSKKDIIDNLTTNDAKKPLSAKMGVELKRLIDGIDVPTKVSQLTNDAEFVTADKTITRLPPDSELNMDALPAFSEIAFNRLSRPAPAPELSENETIGSCKTFASIQLCCTNTPEKTGRVFYRSYTMAGWGKWEPLGVTPEQVAAWDAKLSQADLQGGIDTALAQAKESKQFDGFSPTVGVQPTENGHTVTVTDKDGPKQFQVENGKDAEFTPEIKQEIAGMVDTGIPVQVMSEPTAEIKPGIFYQWPEMPSLTVTLATGKEDEVSLYAFGFISGEKPTTLSVPESVKWDGELKVEANKKYEVSIRDGIGVIIGV